MGVKTKFPFGQNWSKTGKYRSKKVERDGQIFDSKLEAEVYGRIKAREAKGEIKLVKRQSRVILTDARIAYVADFECLEIATNEALFIEAKGMKTPVWAIKLRLWRHYGPGKLEIWGGSYTNPKLIETVIAIKR